MKSLLPILFAFLGTVAFAQTTDYQSIPLKNAQDCKAAEPVVLQAANYVLSTPYQVADQQRTSAMQLLIKWMGDTPDFTFDVDDDAGKLVKSDPAFLSLYMAAMAKFCLENPGSATDTHLLKVTAFTAVLNYFEDSNNNLTMSRKLKELSDAKANGELDKKLK